MHTKRLSMNIKPNVKDTSNPSKFKLKRIETNMWMKGNACKSHKLYQFHLFLTIIIFKTSL